MSLSLYPATIALRHKINVDGSETEKRLASMLFDDSVQVLSSFELNQIASLTYGDEPCDDIFSLLQEVMHQAVEHSVLSVQKSLVIMRHVLVYGSERTVRSAKALRDYVRELEVFNTVLAAQQKKGVTALWLQVKGGSVDRGFPVREEAAKLSEILARDDDQLRRLRNDRADPNSLVPVGDDRVAFASDEVRHYMLRRRMEEQQLIRTKSNLAKAEGGFGSGLATKDGKSVVGAAHSLEEMMAHAERENKKFTEDGPVHFKPATPSKKGKKKKKASNAAADVDAAETKNNGAEIDLLDLGAASETTAAAAAAPPEPPVDLLGFETTTSTTAPPAPPSNTLDIFAVGSTTILPRQQSTTTTTTTPTTTTAQPPQDLLGVTSLSTAAPTPGSSMMMMMPQDDLLGVSTSSVPLPQSQPPLSTSTARPTGAVHQTADVFGLMSLTGSSTSSFGIPPAPPSTPAADHLHIQQNAATTTMSSPSSSVMMSTAHSQRFAALDEIGPTPEAKRAGSVLTALEAQNRILGVTSTSYTTTSKTSRGIPSDGINNNGHGSAAAESKPAWLISDGGDRDGAAANTSMMTSMASSITIPTTTTTTTTTPSMPAAMGTAINGTASSSSSSSALSSAMAMAMATATASSTAAGGRGGVADSSSYPPSSSFGIGGVDQGGGIGGGPLPSTMMGGGLPPTATTTTMGIAERYGNFGGDDDDDDDDGGFIMGGAAGMGLEPTANMPSCPPPPPPSAATF